jgi:beta-lactamase regulating signal transducer with metallopeptidase domain
MRSLLLRASIDGAIAVSLVWLVCRACPRLTAATRAWLWWLAAAKFVVALVWTAPILLPQAPPVEIVNDRSNAPPAVADVAAIDGPIASGTAGAADAVGVATARPIVAPANPWPVALNLMWVVGVFVAAGLAVRDWRRASRLVAQSSAATPDILGIVQPLASRLSLGRVPEVRMSPDVETPLVVGVARPVVLLPAIGFARLSDRQRQMSICHELVHIRRADLRLGCVPALAELLFFFHPFTRLAAREYALAREAACDAAVLEALDAAPQEYGRLLVDLGVAEPRARLAAAGASWSSSTLKRRLVMLNNLSSVSSPSRVLAAVAIAVAAVSIVPVKLVARQAPRPATVSPAKPITTTVEPKLATTTVSAGKQTLRMTTKAVPQVKAATPAPQKTAPVYRLVQKPATKRLYVGMPDDQTIVIGSDVVLFRGAASTAADAAAFRYRLAFRKAADSDAQASQAVERAKTFRKEGEAMIWFKRNDHEYVVRDADTIKEVESLVAAPRFYSVNVVDRAATPADLTAQIQELQAKLADLAVQLKSADKADAVRLQTAALGKQLESIGRRLQEPTARYTLSSKDTAAWVRQPDNTEIFAALDRAIAKGTAQQVK